MYFMPSLLTSDVLALNMSSLRAATSDVGERKHEMGMMEPCLIPVGRPGIMSSGKYSNYCSFLSWKIGLQI